MIGGIARADPAYRVVSGAAATSVNAQTVGWVFRAGADLRVDAMGFYDAGGDGLSEPHDVGLWSSAGTLLARTTVVDGPLDGGFRYGAVPAVDLTAQHWYYVGAFFTAGGPDPFLFNDVIVERHPLIPQTVAAYGLGSNLRLPDTLVVGRPLYAGPNLRITPVPEPATAGLILMTGVALVRRRRSGA
jgi:hypothetical protein